jgi:DhnA family fructose-bisphosphate aldolase class Ia
MPDRRASATANRPVPPTGPVVARDARVVVGPAGLARRLGRLFDPASGLSITVALDHGIAGVPAGFEAPRRLIEAVLAARPDALIMNAGLVRRCADLLARRDAPATILGVDHVIHESPRGGGGGVAHVPLISVEEAIRIGADCVKAMLLMGDPDRPATAANLAYLARLGEACRLWEMPLMIEPYLWGAAVPDDVAGRAELNADGARMAVELGADILKLEVGGDIGRFREIVRTAPVPVVVLGGPKRETARATLADVVAAAEAGAVGLTIGRNVWGQRDPAAMTNALRVAMKTQDLDAALAALRERD